MQPEAIPDRRTVVAAVLGCAGLGALAACGSANDSTTSTTATSGGGDLAKLSQVPLGGSLVVQGGAGNVAIAQPTAGSVVAFSAICTHQGCTVQAAGKQLRCPCHGSVFDAFTGQVQQGPAQAPLNKVNVSVSGQDVVAG